MIALSYSVTVATSVTIREKFNSQTIIIDLQGPLPDKLYFKMSFDSFQQAHMSRSPLPGASISHTNPVSQSFPVSFYF